MLLSYNNAGIDDSLIGGVVADSIDGYRIADQWASYGWNVICLDDGNDYDQVLQRSRRWKSGTPTTAAR